jgi:ADP-ribosylglycohydrolase
MARNGASRDQMRNAIESRFCYDLVYKIDEIRPNYEYSERCLETVPAALIAFLDSNGFEDAVRKAVSLGGDADTLAAITGAIAEAYYGELPEPIVSEVRRRLPPELWRIIEQFSRRIAAP